MTKKPMAKKQLKTDPLKEVEEYDPEAVAEFGRCQSLSPANQSHR